MTTLPVRTRYSAALQALPTLEYLSNNAVNPHLGSLHLLLLRNADQTLAVHFEQLVAGLQLPILWTSSRLGYYTSGHHDPRLSSPLDKRRLQPCWLTFTHTVNRRVFQPFKTVKKRSNVQKKTSDCHFSTNILEYSPTA